MMRHARPASDPRPPIRPTSLARAWKPLVLNSRMGTNCTMSLDACLPSLFFILTSSPSSSSIKVKSALPTPTLVEGKTIAVGQSVSQSVSQSSQSVEETNHSVSEGCQPVSQGRQPVKTVSGSASPDSLSIRSSAGQTIRSMSTAPVGNVLNPRNK